MFGDGFLDQTPLLFVENQCILGKEKCCLKLEKKVGITISVGPLEPSTFIARQPATVRRPGREIGDSQWGIREKTGNEYSVAFASG